MIKKLFKKSEQITFIHLLINIVNADNNLTIEEVNLLDKISGNLNINWKRLDPEIQLNDILLRFNKYEKR